MEDGIRLPNEEDPNNPYPKEDGWDDLIRVVQLENGPKAEEVGVRIPTQMSWCPNGYSWSVHVSSISPT